MDQLDDAAEARALNIRLGSLGWDSLIEEAEIHGLTAATVVADACEQLSAWPPSRIAVPRFGAGPGSVVQAKLHRLVVSLSAASWSRLEDEAARRGIRLESLVRHAILIFLARNV